MTSAIVSVDDPDAHRSEAPPRRRRRRRRWPWVAVLVSIGIGVGGATIPTPYLLYSPGSARAVESRIQISGPESFDADGTIFFLTVSESEARPFTLIRAWLDDTIDVLRQDEVYPEGGRREDRVINQQRMEESKFVATSLALEAVGYPVVGGGGGGVVGGGAPGSAADGTIQQGDVIVAIDGEEVTTRDQAAGLLRSHPPGSAVTVSLRSPAGTRRDGVSVVLGAREDDPTQGLLGVVLTTAERNLELPFPIEIESGRVTGPSAGLAFTLGVIDRLTPGALTGGRRIAVTGSIDEEGNVLPIGGLPQKSVAAMDAGAKVLLYPADSTDEDVTRLRSFVGSRMELVPVATLDEALEYLAPDGLPKAPGATAED